MRLRKRTYFIASFIAMLIIFSFSIPVLADGTERHFYVELPKQYNNTYFQERTKETDYNYGWIKCTDKESDCQGFNAWFCDNGTVIKSNIVYVKYIGNNTYQIRYNMRYGKGEKARLGLEDYDYTVLEYHTVEGYVNYN